MKTLRKLLIWLLIPCLLAVGLYVFRHTLLKGLGQWLIAGDVPRKADAVFVLSGDPADRSAKGRQLVQEGYAPLLVTTGSGVSASLLVRGDTITDAELTRSFLIRTGMDSLQVRALPVGTSTWEEAELVAGYCEREGYEVVLVVTSQFHTRRTRQVFRQALRAVGVDVTVIGAPPSEYSTDAWWESEKGLLFVYDEYIKLIYYWLKY